VATTHMEPVVGEEYPRQTHPSLCLSGERCHARCSLHALLEEKMVPHHMWRPGRQQHLEISLPSLQAEELEAFPVMIVESA
jgi:hypothetical protein